MEGGGERITVGSQDLKADRLECVEHGLPNGHHIVGPLGDGRVAGVQDRK